MHLSQELWGSLSLLLAAVSLTPYLLSTLRGQTKPHIFTWIIWLILTVIAAAIQISSGAGPGAWPTVFTACACLLILIASFFNGEKTITKSDWLTFVAAIVAIPLWMLTKNPAVAAIWVTGIDALGYYPTFRKSWHKPHEEMVFTHTIASIKHVLALLALTSFNVGTAFYPIGLIVMNSALVSMIVWRRTVLK